MLKISPELARIHAHLCGDGGLYLYRTAEKDRINRAMIVYFNSNVGLINSFRKDMNQLFGVKMTYIPNKQRVQIQSLRIADVLFKLGRYGTREWRVPTIIKKASRHIKLEWIKAFCYDDGYTPSDRNVIRVKSMNLYGLKDIKSLLDSIAIGSWITGKNCDDSWYLNIQKIKGLKKFIKVPVRNKKLAGEGLILNSLVGY